MNAFPQPVFRSEPWFEPASMAEVQVEQIRQEAPSAVFVKNSDAEHLSAPRGAISADGHAETAWMQLGSTGVALATSVWR